MPSQKKKRFDSDRAKAVKQSLKNKDGDQMEGGVIQDLLAQRTISGDGRGREEGVNGKKSITELSWKDSLEKL